MSRGGERSRAALALAATLATFGCGGTSIGNPPGATVKLGVVGTTGPKPLSLDVGGGIVFDELWVALREIDLLVTGTCSADDDHVYDFGAPIVADLLTGDILPAAPEWERAPDETYCELRAKLDVLDEERPGAPAALAGHTVLARGRRADDTPFELRSDVGERLTLGPKSGGFALGAGEVGIVLAFDLSEWLEPDLLDAAEVTAGTVMIGGGDNPALAESLEERIPKSASLFRDDDRDGQLDQDDEEDRIDD